MVTSKLILKSVVLVAVLSNKEANMPTNCKGCGRDIPIFQNGLCRSCHSDFEKSEGRYNNAALMSPSDEQSIESLMAEEGATLSKVTPFVKPKQYHIGIDTFQRMRANATYEEAMGFIRWNIDKYNTRVKGEEASDYNKIIAYANEALWWIERENAKSD